MAATTKRTATDETETAPIAGDGSNRNATGRVGMKEVGEGAGEITGDLKLTFCFVNGCVSALSRNSRSVAWLLPIFSLLSLLVLGDSGRRAATSNVGAATPSERVHESEETR